MLDRAHHPGEHKRWYLRALQEVYDARLRPVGWNTADFTPGDAWMHAALLDGPPDKPAACQFGQGNDTISRANPDKSALRARQIPPVQVSNVPAERLADQGRVSWRRDPNDWFDMQIPHSFDIARADVATRKGDGWEIPATPSPRDGIFLTFEFKKQVVGWPYFTIDAPAGTIVELMVQGGHDLKNGPLWLDTHLYSWTRFICREGENRFRTFDYESARWVQLHIRNASRPVTIRNVGIRRRMYPWPVKPHIVCDDPALQRLFDASVNTTYNSAIETYVDGMGRERQQYSGDGGVQIFLVRYALGDNLLARRYLRTFSEGESPDGYFMDCWPAYDRLARIAQKQIDGAYWGPILDHGIAFNFDCWWHYLYSGDLDGLKEPYPHLLRFAAYLENLRKADGLLPVENLGIPTVWMDHIAYKQQRHKKCSFNLYAAAMFKHALAPICRAMGDTDRAAHFDKVSDSLLKDTIARFWNDNSGRFEDNLPWQKEEGEVRMSDRTLATSILFDQCPENRTAPALKALVDCPPEMGLSYPANANWRYWALGKLGRADVIVKDWRKRWAKMPSVIQNDAIQENWHARPDSSDLWSHCAVSPVYVLFMDVAGIKPAAPGFKQCVIRPQLTGFKHLEVTAHTAAGPIPFVAHSEKGGHRVTVTVPKDCEAELQLPPTAHPDLEALSPDTPQGLKRYRLVSGAANTFFVPGGS